MAKNPRGINIKGKWGTLKKIAKNYTLSVTKRKYNNKIIITGTGRTGTSFLVVLLTRLGLDTGFEPYNEDFSDKINAGCEYKLFTSDAKKQKKIFSQAPQILKHPEYSYRLEKLLDNGSLGVSNVIIPIRNLQDATKSRIKAGLYWTIPGINKKTDGYSGQLRAVTWALGSIVSTCITREIPTTFMLFPRLTKDSSYCFDKLSHVFPNLDVKDFTKVFNNLKK